MAQTAMTDMTANSAMFQQEALQIQKMSHILIGSSAAMRELRALIVRIARSHASVLITGPSGSGKEVVARCLHEFSPRKDNAFVALNCAAVPRELLESELFGHEKGSFTGAVGNRIGRFEAADSGTLFLDEIGDMPMDMQVKLLRVLELRYIERVGSTRPIPVDIRLVSATHRTLEEEIDQGRFREDLFYRLNIIPLVLPPLAERREDIPELIEHFCQERGHQSVTFTYQAIAVLMSYSWPGNVRELRNLIERAAALYPGLAVGADEVQRLVEKGRGSRTPAGLSPPPYVPDYIPAPPIADSNVVPIRPDISPLGLDPRSIIGKRGCDMRSLLGDLEQALIRSALESSGQIVANAARLLGLQRTTLIEKMRKYQIEKSENGHEPLRYAENAI